MSENGLVLDRRINIRLVGGQDRRNFIGYQTGGIALDDKDICVWRTWWLQQFTQPMDSWGGGALLKRSGYPWAPFFIFLKIALPDLEAVCHGSVLDLLLQLLYICWLHCVEGFRSCCVKQVKWMLLALQFSQWWRLFSFGHSTGFTTAVSTWANLPGFQTNRQADLTWSARKQTWQ